MVVIKFSNGEENEPNPPLHSLWNYLLKRCPLVLENLAWGPAAINGLIRIAAQVGRMFGLALMGCRRVAHVVPRSQRRAKNILLMTWIMDEGATTGSAVASVIM